MKNIKWFKSSVRLLLALPLLLAMTGCPSDGGKYDLRLSVENYTFAAVGGNLTVAVDTNYDNWDVSFDASEEWLSEVSRTENSITFFSVANPSDAFQSVVVTFIAGDIERELTLGLEPNGGVLSEYVYQIPSPDDLIFGITPNLEYFIRIRRASGGGVEMYPFHIQTGERLPAVATVSGITDGSNIAAVTNDAQALILTVVGTETTTRSLIRNGQTETFTAPAGYSNAQVQSMNDDGTVVVGYARNNATSKDTPIKWVNGIPQVLSMPQYTQPDEDDNVVVQEVTGVAATVVSPDGSVVAGTTLPGNYVVYWKEGADWEWAGDGNFVNQPYRDVEGNIQYRDIFYHSIWPHKITPDNKYLSMRYQTWGQQRLGMNIVDTPALLNLETGEIEWIGYEMISNPDYVAPSGGVNSFLMSDGRLFVTTRNYLSNFSDSLFLVDGELINTKAYLESIMNGMFIGNYLKIHAYQEDPFLVWGDFQLSELAGGQTIPFFITKRNTATE